MCGVMLCEHNSSAAPWSGTGNTSSFTVVHFAEASLFKPPASRSRDPQLPELTAMVLLQLWVSDKCICTTAPGAWGRAKADTLCSLRVDSLTWVHL